jgi:hypothetical protein
MSQLNSQQTPSNNQQQNLNQNVNIQMSSSANSLSHIQPHHQPHHSNAHRKLFASSMDNSNSHVWQKLYLLNAQLVSFINRKNLKNIGQYCAIYVYFLG